MLNKILLMGRLTRDPEMRRTQSGTAVAAFTLAVERDGKKADGTREADFIDCVAWNKTGEMVCKYFAKGRMAVVEGRLQLGEYTDREGIKRRTAQVVVDSVYFGDSKHQSAPQSAQAPAPQGYGQGYGQATAQAPAQAPAPQGGYAPQGYQSYQQMNTWEGMGYTDDGELPF